MAYYKVYLENGTVKTFHHDSIEEAFEDTYKEHASNVAQGISFYQESSDSFPPTDHYYSSGQWVKIGSTPCTHNSTNPVEQTAVESIGQNLAYFFDELF